MTDEKEYGSTLLLRTVGQKEEVAEKVAEKVEATFKGVLKTEAVVKASEDYEKAEQRVARLKRAHRVLNEQSARLFDELTPLRNTLETRLIERAGSESRSGPNPFRDVDELFTTERRYKTVGRAMERCVLVEQPAALIASLRAGAAFEHAIAEGLEQAAAAHFAETLKRMGPVLEHEGELPVQPNASVSGRLQQMVGELRERAFDRERQAKEQEKEFAALRRPG